MSFRSSFSGSAGGTRFLRHFRRLGKKRVPPALPLNGVGIVLLFVVVTSCASADSLTKAPAGIDAALWNRMLAVDAKAGKIVDLTADFEQQKFTPLLKKPMISSGTVQAKGTAMLWDTRTPEPTIMRVDETEVSLFYPKQKTVEIYPLAGQLSSLAASPLPRLTVLIPHFSFTPGAAKDFGQEERADRLVIHLTPTEATLREHVDSVTVLIDAERGFILAFQLVDSDGEKTVIRFSNVKTNTNLEDAGLKLKLPAEIKTVRPLEHLGGPPASPRK